MRFYFKLYCFSSFVQATESLRVLYAVTKRGTKVQKDCEAVTQWCNSTVAGLRYFTNPNPTSLTSSPLELVKRLQCGVTGLNCVTQS